MYWKSLSLTLILCVTLTAIGNADTLLPSINPSHENTLIESSAGTLSNAQGSIFAGRTAQPAGTSIRRGLIEFDIADAGIPLGATITGGTLTMTDATPGTTGTQTLTLHDVSQAWGQGTSYSSGGVGAPATTNDATWLNTFYSTSSPPTWTNAGGDFSATVSGSAIDSTNGQSVVWSSASNPLIVSDLQSWLNDPSTNFGWLIQGNESVGQTAKLLGAGPNYGGVEPTLSIAYAVPEPSTVWLTVSALVTITFVKRRGLGGRPEPIA